MVLQKSPILYASPRRKQVSKSFAPKRGVLQRVDNTHTRRVYPTQNRYSGRPEAALPAIYEEDEAYTDDRQARSYCNSHVNDDEDEEDELDWNHEETLVAIFKEEFSVSSDDDDLLAIAEELGKSMSSQTDSINRYSAQALVPALKRVRQAHLQTEKKVDPGFTDGILKFDAACRAMEAMAIREEDEFKSVHLQTQANIKKLFTKLEEATRQRNKVWDDYLGIIDKIADAAQTELNAFPADLERMQSNLEKRSKAMHKDDKKTQENMVKRVMDNL